MLSATACCLIAAALAQAPEPTDSPADSPAEADPTAEVLANSAEALYDQGEQAYWLGDFAEAVIKFEAAYAASRHPGLLYNVGLAYFRRFELTKQRRDLERARAVLRNYADELERDPSLGQAENLRKLLAQLDTQLEQPEAPSPTIATPPPAISCPEPVPLPPVAPPPTRRLAGPVIMGSASVVLAAGITTTLAFAIKGNSFRQQLKSLRAEQAAAGCGTTTSATCDYLASAATTTIANGNKANMLAAGLGGGLSALGVAGLVTGAVLHLRDRPATRAKAKLQFGPTFGGVVLRGSF